MKNNFDIRILTDRYDTIGIDIGKTNELDIGCGKGGFTCALAQKYPERAVFAADVMLGRLRKLGSRISRTGISNITLLRVDACALPAYILPDSSIDRIHILCPDPWPKARHRGNRLMSSEFIGKLLRILNPGGVVHFATDDVPYLNSVVSLFSQDISYIRDDSAIADLSDIKSDFEIKWESEGTRVEHSGWRKVERHEHRTLNSEH
ncbi:MAG TPA: hypothetical protein DCZ94_17915 [Lentisphaeria bacterium]|nr:MAG: hypothetical protein A2X48_20720 [Lentisphaerae bacterium GWF2_49_21]HBC88823.1 hypothetical protein [Lentisphaeria bacterium]